MAKMRQRTDGTTKCTLCRTETTRYLTGGDYYHYNCPQCGRFWATGSARALLEDRDLNSDQREELLGAAPLEDGSPWIHTGLLPRTDAGLLSRTAAGLPPTQPPMFRRIFIDNYKSLVNFDLRLQDLTLLLGQNGAGKTAVLDVVYALRRLLEGTARVTDRDVFPPSSLTRWQERNVQRFRLEAELEGGVYEYCLDVEHDRRGRRARIALERLSKDEGRLFNFAAGDVQLYRDDHSEGPTFKADWRESALARVAAVDDNVALTRFVEFVRGVLVRRLNPPALASEAAGEDPILARDAQNFVDWYRHLLQERPHLYQEYVDVLGRALDGLRSLSLEKAGVDTRVLSAVVGEADEGHGYRFHELSDGQRALIVLYAITLLTDEGAALFIDEPVNYVGLREIQPRLIALADACGSQVSQAVLCSHHPEVIDYLGGDRGVLLWRDGDGPTRTEYLAERPGDSERDAALRLSQLIARGWER